MNDRPAFPVRIAFCITELDPGGAEQCLTALVERIDRGRYEPVVYCLGPRPAGNPDSLADRIERSGAALHCLGARRKLQFAFVARALKRHFQRDPPQIVQSFLIHANLIATWAARHAGRPPLVTGIRVAERRPQGHLTLARWGDRYVQRHVCVSQAVKEFSHERGRLPLEKLVVIPNGVDVERYASATPCPLSELGLAPGRRAITCVGRLDEQKGLDWLLHFMPGVFNDLPMHDLLLVGAGPKRKRLEGLVARLGLADRVHFAGFRADVPEILAASDVLVLPSRWEGMPNVILEAMAAGRPVVATDVEGVTEALGPAAAQQVVRLDHAEAFAAKIRGILQNPALAADLGRQNQARARAAFRIEAMVEAYERLYESLLPAKS